MAGFGGLIEGVVLVVFALAGSAISIVALLYVALRVRDSRETDPDNQLGKKTAFHTIHTVAVLMVLTGLTVFMIDALEGTIAAKPVPARGAFAPPAKAGGFNPAQRVAVALVAVGTLFGLVFWGFLMTTNDATRTGTRRVFVGGRMTLCMLITMFTVTALAVNLIQKVPVDSATEAFLAVLLVWLPGAAIHMVLFHASMSDGRERGGSGGREDRTGGRWSDD